MRTPPIGAVDNLTVAGENRKSIDDNINDETVSNWHVYSISYDINAVDTV